MNGLGRQEAQVLALAGLVQAAGLALAIARDGRADPAASAASLASVLRLNADSPEAVYGSLGGVRNGLRLLVAQLRGEQRDADLVRIAATIVSLERKYARSERLQRELRRQLEAMSANAAGAADAVSTAPGDALLQALAQAYLATISTLTPRVRVPGNPLVLKEEANVVRIRAHLLAALRSAALWRQLGGRGWRVLLQRRALIETAQRLLGRSLAAL